VLQKTGWLVLIADQGLCRTWSLAMSANGTNNTIVAIHLAKYKSVACVYHGDPATEAFASFLTDREHLHKLFAKYRPDAVEHDLDQDQFRQSGMTVRVVGRLEA
jgi:hypothetical protein